MLIFSIKNAFRKKTSAILASLGIAFGLMIVFVIGAFTAGLQYQFQQNLSRTLGIVNVIERGAIMESESQLPLNLTDDIYNIDGIGADILKYNVRVKGPYDFTLKYRNKLLNDGDQVVLVGLNKTLDEDWEGFTTEILQGRSFEVGQNETIISNRLNKNAKFPASIGDQIEIYLDPLGIKTRNLTIVGIYESIEDGTPSFIPRDYDVFSDIQIVWEALDSIGRPNNTYSTISFKFDVENQEETTAYVEIMNNYSDSGGFAPLFISAVALATFYEAIQENLAIIDTFANVFGFISVLAGGMAIIVTQLMSVNSRLKEFAIQKATGWKNRHIFLNITLESIILGILGAAMGFTIGAIIILVLSGEDSPFGAAPAIVTAGGIIQVFLYALLLSVLGSLYPGIKAARIRPIQVLKNE